MQRPHASPSTIHCDCTDHHGPA